MTAIFFETTTISITRMRGVSRTLACLNHHKEMLRESNIVSTAVDGMGGGRTDADREAQGSTVTATIFFLHQRLFFSCKYVKQK